MLTLDRGLPAGRHVPIEQRSPRQLTDVAGRSATGPVLEVQLAPEGKPAENSAFDVTPARLVAGLVTSRGIVATEAAAIAAL